MFAYSYFILWWISLAVGWRMSLCGLLKQKCITCATFFNLVRYIWPFIKLQNFSNNYFYGKRFCSKFSAKYFAGNLYIDLHLLWDRSIYIYIYICVPKSLATEEINHCNTSWSVVINNSTIYWYLDYNLCTNWRK